MNETISLFLNKVASCMLVGAFFVFATAMLLAKLTNQLDAFKHQLYRAVGWALRIIAVACGLFAMANLMLLDIGGTVLDALFVILFIWFAHGFFQDAEDYETLAQRNEQARTNNADSDNGWDPNSAEEHQAP